MWGTCACERNPPGQRQTGHPPAESASKSKRGSYKKTHPDVAVDDEADAEQAIEERRGRAGGHEGGGGEREEARGEQTLERPVIGPVRPSFTVPL